MVIKRHKYNNIWWMSFWIDENNSCGIAIEDFKNRNGIFLSHETYLSYDPEIEFEIL